MNISEIPIFKKTFDLYKYFYLLRNNIPKQDRFTIWQKCENIILGLIEILISMGTLSKEDKLPKMEQMSNDLNLLRVFLRLAKDVKIIDNAKYINMEKGIDEIGRMLGGWIKSIKESSQNKNTPQKESGTD